MAFSQRHHSFVTVLVLFVTISGVSANSGKEFIFTPMPNHPTNAPTTIGVVLQAVTEKETNVRVAAPGRSFEDHISLPPGSGPYNYPLPISLINWKAKGIVNSTVFLTSNQDIHVTSYNLQKETTDTFSAVPGKYLGVEYFVALMSWETSTTYRGVLIVSAFYKTVAIEIFLNSTVLFEDKMYYNGDILRYTLAPFESIQLLPQYINITGSRIVANTSIGVTAGSMCAQVPLGVTACDHLAEQLVPFATWGRFYVIGPFASRRSGYFLQIVAGRDNTTIFYDSSTVNINMGDYITVDISSQKMIFISATKPISIMQYSKGKESDNVTNSDPAMIRNIPIEQYVKETTFPVYEFRWTTTNINTIHLEVTTECKYFKDISVFKDHQPLSLAWEEEYSLVILNGTHMCSRWAVVTEGRYSIQSQRVITADGQAIYPRFRAVVYGTGHGESYLYRAGSYDRPLFIEGVATSDRELDTLDFQGLIHPHVVSIDATEIILNWTTTEDSVGLFDMCTAYIKGGYSTRSVDISTVPPVNLSGLYPNTEYSFDINCSNSFGTYSQVDFSPQTTMTALKIDDDNGRNTHLTMIFMSIIIAGLILLNTITIIIFSVYIYKRKRSDRANNAAVSTSIQTKQIYQSDDPNRYDTLSGQTEDVYQNVDSVYEKDEYEMVTFKDVKKATKI